MLRRMGRAPHVDILSDLTYTGLCRYMETVREDKSSTVIIPDLATLGGRREATARQTIAFLAMICAEGVGQTAVGKMLRDYEGKRAGVLTAITQEDLTYDWRLYNQNAFLSRCFLIDFELRDSEVNEMLRRKHRGDDRLLRPVPFRGGVKRLPRETIKLPAKFGAVARRWRDEMEARKFGFRSADAFSTLLQSAAYLRNARQVSEQDVKTVGRLSWLWHRQFTLANGDSIRGQ